MNDSNSKEVLEPNVWVDDTNSGVRVPVSSLPPRLSPDEVKSMGILRMNAPDISPEAWTALITNRDKAGFQKDKQRAVFQEDQLAEVCLISDAFASFMSALLHNVPVKTVNVFAIINKANQSVTCAHKDKFTSPSTHRLLTYYTATGEESVLVVTCGGEEKSLYVTSGTSVLIPEVVLGELHRHASPCWNLCVVQELELVRV